MFGVSVCSLCCTTKCQSIVMFNTDQNMTCSPPKKHSINQNKKTKNNNQQ